VSVCDVLICGEYPEWIDEAVDSLKHDDVLIHKFPFVDNIGKSRKLALENLDSDSEYMCWFDSDDLLVPGSINSCMDILNTHIDLVGVYTNEVRIDKNGKDLDVLQRSEFSLDGMLNNRMFMHKLTVVRKLPAVFASQFLDNLKMVELFYFYCGCLYFGKFKLNPIIGHKWRIWGNNQLHKRGGDIDRLRIDGRCIIGEGICVNAI
jgi:hypothetical protein